MPVQAALQYMEEHLDEPLDFPSLAKALHYSKYNLLHSGRTAAARLFPAETADRSRPPACRNRSADYAGRAMRRV